MKKTPQKYFMIIIIISIILLGWVFLLNKKADNKNPLLQEAYVKNLTWETDISKTVPYTKGNLLEYLYIITPKEASKIIINLKNLVDNLNVKTIEVNWEWQDINKTILEVEVKEITTLKITWEAINNSSEKEIQEKTPDKIIDIEVKAPIKTEEDNNTKNPEESINNNSEIIEEEKDKKIIAKNISLNNYNFSSNINNLIEISWENLDLIQYVNIWWNSYSPIEDGGKLYFNIPQDSFDTGEYFVLLQMKNWKLSTLDKKINFTFVDSEINISNITPNTIKNDKAKMIVLQWNWFKKIISMQLSNNIVIKNTSFNIISDNVMSVQIPSGLQPWKYHFNIMDTSGITEIKEMNFTITK